MWISVSLFLQAFLSVTNVLMIIMAITTGMKTVHSLRLWATACTEWPTCQKAKINTDFPQMAPLTGRARQLPDGSDLFLLKQTFIIDIDVLSLSAVLLLKPLSKTTIYERTEYFIHCQLIPHRHCF